MKENANFFTEQWKKESMNSKPSGSIDEDEEGIDSERDKIFKEEEL